MGCTVPKLFSLSHQAVCTSDCLPNPTPRVGGLQCLPSKPKQYITSDVYSQEAGCLYSLECREGSFSETGGSKPRLPPWQSLSVSIHRIAEKVNSRKLKDRI